MTDIIITAQNPEQLDVAEMRRFFWGGLELCVFRGARRADISEGDRVYLQYRGSLWGFVYFDRYDAYMDENMQGDEVLKPNAMYLRPPMHRFDVPVDLRKTTTNYGWRYVDPTKYSPETIRDLHRQTEIAESRAGWFGPGCDFTGSDPDPFPEALMGIVRASMEEGDYLLGTREELVEYIQESVLPFVDDEPLFERIATCVENEDWDEAIALTLCTMISDSGEAYGPVVPIIRNGGFLYCENAQMECLGPPDPDWVTRLRGVRDENGEVEVMDLFSNDIYGFAADDEDLEPAQLWRARGTDRTFGVNDVGFIFQLEPRPKRVSRRPAGKSAPTKPTKPKAGKGGE